MTSVTLLAACAFGCMEPPKQNVPLHYADNLRDVHFWHPENGAQGHYAYDTMIGSDPAEAVPVLIGKLSDTSDTAINDGLHEPVPVCNVVFHILIRIFGMKPEAFEREGVWVMHSDPSKNPIYKVKFKDDETRARLKLRFETMAIQRGWMEPP